MRMEHNVNKAVRFDKFENEYLCFLNGLSIPKNKLKLRYASVFCGGGGLDLGFSLAGFAPTFSSDIVPQYCETVANNLGKRGHVVEAHNLSLIHI